MFVHPRKWRRSERHPEISKPGSFVDNPGWNDRMTCTASARRAARGLAQTIEDSVRSITKLRARCVQRARQAAERRQGIEDAKKYD